MKKLLLLFILVNFIAAPSFAVKIITNDYSDRIVPSRSSQYDSSVPVDEYYYYSEKAKKNNVRPVSYKYKYANEVGWLADKARTEVVGGRWLYENPNKQEKIDGNGKYNVDVEGRLPKGIEEINIEKKKYNSREAADYYTVDIKNSGKGRQEAVRTPSGNMIIDDID